MKFREHEEIDFLNLHDHFETLAETQPDNIALVSADREGKVIKEITYSELKNKIESLASWLLEYADPGEVVSLAFPNSLEQLLLSWAAWSVGILTAPLDIKRDALQRHNYKIHVSQSKIVIAHRGHFKDTTHLAADVVEIDNHTVEGTKKPQWMTSMEHQCLILFTSGTTAKPKGAQLSLKNLVANAEGIKNWFNILSGDRFLVLLPLYHINSTTFTLATLLAGAANIVVPGYSKSKFWLQMSNTKATFSSIVQTICFDQLSEVDNFEKVKDRIAISRIQIGSAPVVASDARTFIDTFTIPLFQGYGQTETALRVTGVPLTLDTDTYDTLVSTNSIGTPMKWADVEIMDKDGNLLTEGEEGEIVVKGPAVMKSYLKTTDGFKNGYFLTGDIGYFEMIKGKRFFYLKGRSNEIIIKGGINISPVAVEDRLKKVDDNIDQVYAIPVSDHRYGEEVGVAIVWKDVVSAEATAKLKQKLLKLQDYETPKYITTITENQLPMTSTGKVQRSVLKSEIPVEQFESVHTLAVHDGIKFVQLTPHTQYSKQAFDVYNYCWQPLSIDSDTWTKHITNGVVIAAIENNNVRGMVSFMRTNQTSKELAKQTYDTFTDHQTLSSHDPDGANIVCVSICSDTYKPEDITDVNKPSVAEMKDYLLTGKDPVFNFHAKPKGGVGGSKLKAIMPEGRPLDTRSLGYLMLLQYPSVYKKPNIESTSVAAQLIEAVMVYAHTNDIKDIYALSRPSGLSRLFKK